MLFQIINKINKFKRIIFLTFIAFFICSSTLFALCLDPITGELTEDCDDPASIDVPLDNYTYILVALTICLSVGFVKNQKLNDIKTNTGNIKNC